MQGLGAIVFALFIVFLLVMVVALCKSAKSVTDEELKEFERYMARKYLDKVNGKEWK